MHKGLNISRRLLESSHRLILVVLFFLKSLSEKNNILFFVKIYRIFVAIATFFNRHACKSITHKGMVIAIYSDSYRKR